MQIRYCITGIIAAILLSAAQASAQRYADTFYVTVADKTPEHPYYNQGYSKGYLINGLQSPTLTLVRDSLYLFDTEDVPNNLVFHFYTIPIGGSTGIYIDHIEDQDVSKGLWVIKATDEDPDTLYYACSRQPWMGGMILVVDAPISSVKETGTLSALAGTQLFPNPFAQHTELRCTLDAPSRVRVEIVNAAGQLVASQDAGIIEAGEAHIRLDGDDLAPGVYFYRVEALSGNRSSTATGTMQVVR